MKSEGSNVLSAPWLAMPVEPSQERLLLESQESPSSPSNGVVEAMEAPLERLRSRPLACSSVAVVDEVLSSKAYRRISSSANPA